MNLNTINLSEEFNAKITATQIAKSFINEKQEYFLEIENERILGDCLDKMPCGIINKTITGIGATTLELNSRERNSIIVVPTKALAYNKMKVTNKTFNDEYALYIGSAIGTISSLDNDDIKNYLSRQSGLPKKILVVADSLPRLVEIFEEECIDYTADYFLMIDEVDTMQIDSIYRSNLEKILDYYFEFPLENRCMVSATLNEFSDTRIQEEKQLNIIYSTPQEREIKLVYTNYTDHCTFRYIKEYMESRFPNDKILIAYNSLKGIFNLVTLLENQDKEYGILCSERSFEKISKFRTDKNYKLDYENPLQDDGKLKHPITFMTCAFFAGIDINEDCHIITISSHKQLFTVLSPNRMKQIVGRCRNNVLSETIIYDDSSAYPQNNTTPPRSKEEIVEKATRISNLMNQILDLSKDDRDFLSVYNKMKGFFLYKSEENSNQKDAVRTIRKNSKNNTFAPAYFNIDAVIIANKTKELYKDKTQLKKALEQENHIHYKEKIYKPEDIKVQNIEEINSWERETEQEILAEIREHFIGASRLRGISTKSILKNIYNFDNINNRKIKQFCDLFFKYEYYIDGTFLFDELAKKYNNKVKLRNFINALVFHILPDAHIFKAMVITKSKLNNPNEELRLNSTDLLTFMRDIFNTISLGDGLADKTLQQFFSSFFKKERIAGTHILRNLNPLEIPDPIKTLPPNVDILEHFILPEHK